MFQTLTQVAFDILDVINIYMLKIKNPCYHMPCITSQEVTSLVAIRLHGMCSAIMYSC